MIVEKLCGSVVFTEAAGGIKFVIIQSLEGFYVFWEGHIEEVKTTLREIEQEPGAIELISGFKIEDRHTFERSGETQIKCIVAEIRSENLERNEA